MYEEFCPISRKASKCYSARNYFSQTIELSPTDADLLIDILPNLNQLGFDIEAFGKNAFVINGLPPDISEDANANKIN